MLLVETTSIHTVSDGTCHNLSLCLYDNRGIESSAKGNGNKEKWFNVPNASAMLSSAQEVDPSCALPTALSTERIPSSSAE